MKKRSKNKRFRFVILCVSIVIAYYLFPILNDWIGSLWASFGVFLIVFIGYLIETWFYWIRKGK